MRRLEKMFWAILCGTALGAAACGDDTAEYGPPNDAASDGTPDVTDVAGETAEDPIEDMFEEEMPMTEYGPVPDM